jgi:hypothetical protein
MGAQHAGASGADHNLELLLSLDDRTYSGTTTSCHPLDKAGEAKLRICAATTLLLTTRIQESRPVGDNRMRVTYNLSEHPSPMVLPVVQTPRLPSSSSWGGNHHPETMSSGSPDMTRLL